MMSDEHASPVTQDHIAALAQKLADWSEELPPEHRSLAQLLVEHARSLRPEDIQRKQIMVGVADATRAVIKTVNDLWHGGVEGWAKIGPVWYKKNKVEFGEEVEINQRIFLREQR
jgi:hypothetical protein